MNTYLQIFLVNPLICIGTLWILFKLSVNRLLAGVSPGKIAEVLKKLMPPEQIATELIPIAQDLGDTLTEGVPWWVKLFGRNWYNQLTEFTEAVTEKEAMAELVETAIDEIDLAQIVKKNLQKANTGAMQQAITAAFRPWIIGAGIILSIIIGLVQVLLF